MDDEHLIELLFETLDYDSNIDDDDDYEIGEIVSSKKKKKKKKKKKNMSQYFTPFISLVQ